MLTVEWRKVVSGDNSYSFQLKLYNNGDIEFCYGPMTINSSKSVLVGMMSSDADIYRVGGANGGSEWSDITRYTSGTSPRTLSTSYHPEYNTTTNQGMVYTFTQPACVKPTGLTATATAWNTIDVEWTVSSNGNGYEVKYSTNPDFNPDNELHHMPKKIRLWMEVASRLLNEDMIKEWLPWNYVEVAGLLPPDETLQEDPAPPDDGQQKSAAPNC